MTHNGLVNPSQIYESESPACYSEVFQGSREMTVPLSKLEPHLDNCTMTLDDSSIEPLAQSIAEFGLIRPLVVVENFYGQYDTVCGNRRLLAMRSILVPSTEVPCVVLSDAVDKQSIELLRIEDNNSRNKTRFQHALEWWQYREAMQAYRQRSAERSAARIVCDEKLAEAKFPESKTAQKYLSQSVAFIISSEQRQQEIQQFNSMSLTDFYMTRVNPKTEIDKQDSCRSKQETNLEPRKTDPEAGGGQKNDKLATQYTDQAKQENCQCEERSMADEKPEQQTVSLKTCKSLLGKLARACSHIASGSTVDLINQLNQSIEEDFNIQSSNSTQ